MSENHSQSDTQTMTPSQGGGAVAETRKKLIRVTTADISLEGLLKGQLKFLNQYFDVVGLASDTQGDLKVVEEREGIRTINVPMHREISLFSDLKCLLKLYKLFRKERPYIVHANTPKGSLLSMIASWAARVPHRIYLVTGLRYLGANGKLKWVLKMMERITCCFANKVIPEGNGVKQILIKDGITKKSLDVIHYGNINGIDADSFSLQQTELKYGKREFFRTQLGFNDNDFVFIFIGRIVRDKGMNELADAMRYMEANTRNCKLLLVGRFETELDPLDEGKEDFYRNSANVKFVGYQNDVRPFLMAADALVFPSYREGFPNVILQAGAMGLPAIVTDISGCTDIIIERENGCIIPPKDVDALKDKMSFFCTHPKEVEMMASRARRMIVSRYLQKDVWEYLLKMYKEL